MSPEQARGIPADARADLWAFGCCLYEALTGSRPFSGEDAPQTLASVLKDTPNWSALPPDLPSNLAVLLRRCLEKKTPRPRAERGGPASRDPGEPHRTCGSRTAHDANRERGARSLACSSAAMGTGRGWSRGRDRTADRISARRRRPGAGRSPRPARAGGAARRRRDSLRDRPSSLPSLPTAVALHTTLLQTRSGTRSSCRT